MAIHIGKKIKEELYKQGISVSTFARKINRSRNVVYDIFERESIDTALLNKIGLVLRIDFFSLYSGQKEYTRDPMLITHVKEEKIAYNTLADQLRLVEQQNEFLQKENTHLETENANLRKIIALMEEKQGNPKAKTKK